MSVGNPPTLRLFPLPSSPSNIDERQPLLVPSSSLNGNGDSTTSTTTTDPEDQRKIERQDELGWKSYTFYGILRLVTGLLVLTLLVKGLIDAGDVEFNLRQALMKALGGG